MDRFNKKIFEELISDKQFVRWANGSMDVEHPVWKEWIKKHPEYEKEFLQAYETVRMLTFEPPAVTNPELAYMWEKTKGRFSQTAKTTNLRKITNWYGKIASIILLPLIVGGLLLLQNSLKVNSELKKITGLYGVKQVEITAPLGGRLNFELPDGSVVWLNAGSKLKYPALFSKEKREVEVRGEAYFKIKKKDNPFIVYNPGPDIKVYGTEFNVNSYEDNNDVTVAIASGKVALLYENEEVFLGPGKISYYKKINKQLTIKKGNVEEFSGWREGYFVFRDAPLIKILKTIERQHNVEFIIQDTGITKHKYNASFKNHSLEQIMKMLSFSAPISYAYKDTALNKDGDFLQKIIITEDINRKLK